MELPEVLRAAGEALLIGFLVGAERETSREEAERQPGVRDFILIALTGAVCGLLQNPWLTVAALAAIAGLLAVFHFQVRERSGVTTEMAAVATFCLGFLTAAPGVPWGPALAVGLTVAIAILLEAKRTLHKFIRETITETEFNDTLRFLAIIFIIYPVLPEGAFGPYDLFSPRQVWQFVILVSSISYAGYFLEKFLGARAGVRLAGVLGGLASSTAATASLAKSCSEEPEQTPLYWQAIVLANTVQFPRVLAILSVVNAELARRGAPALAAMTAAGLLIARFASPKVTHARGRPKIRVRNPFRLAPALKFGALFSLILLVSKAAGVALGSRAVVAISAAGGSVDVDAVLLSLADLVRKGAVSFDAAQAGIILALVMNAVVKSLLAAQAGGAALGRRLALAFAAIFAAGALVWWAAGR
ncbi:MAG: MgtC/SapB family protein [Acidobacteriota bacterium]